MSARPIYHDVDGAPVKIGTRVIVSACVDWTLDPRLVGAQGTVRYLEYSCGCGQSYPTDPMIGVELDSGRREELWQEEITPC